MAGQANLRLFRVARLQLLTPAAVAASADQASWSAGTTQRIPHFADCEGDGDVVGVVTPLVRGGAQVLHGDQVVELSVLLEVHEREEEEEDGEGQIEVEGEDELKEKRSCMTMKVDEMRLKNTLSQRGACDPTSKCDEDYALSVHAQVLCILRVFMFVSLYLMWFVSCLSSVLVLIFMLVVVQFSWPVFCSRRYTLYTPPVGDSKLRWLLPNFAAVTFAPNAL